MSALLQFKERYGIANVSGGPLAHPKTLTWKNSQDCCSWKGIECDENTGHVIVLNLESSFLYGSIDNNSTIFQLAHLEKLNLGDNHFNYSPIPSRVGDLSRLTHLNLSASVFSGQVPSEIFKLTRLVYLNLCCNLDRHHDRLLLEMKAPGLRRLSQNLTGLEELLLGQVNMSSQVPNTLANLSSLRRLNMDVCNLHGIFPPAIFHLPKLQYLSVNGNEDLTGRLPNFNSSSPLKELKLRGTSFCGELPASIGNLRSMEKLNLKFCNLTGSLPLSIGNLPLLSYLGIGGNNFSGSIPASFANLSNLEYLDVGENPFIAQPTSSLSWVWKIKKLATLNLLSINLYGEIPPSIGNLSQLVELSFLGNQLSGAIPSQLMNLTQLTHLQLRTNQLSGSIPSWLVNMTQLVVLDLSRNKFHGQIPSSICQLQNLQVLGLFENNFSGTIELDNFLKLKQLWVLQLSSNQLLCRTSSVNVILPQLERGLNSNSTFLKLRILDLSINAFAGKLPMQFFQSWNAMKSETGNFTYMQRNLQPSMIYKGLKWDYPKISEVFTIIDLSSNFFKGEIPSVIGDLKGLQGLNLSNNSLSGHIPSSLGNLTALESLDLSLNKLSGRIPQKLIELGFLSFLNISYNNLTGSVPRGKQFDTFSNNSFEGNSGLCGEFLSKKCQDSGDKWGKPSTHQEEDLASPIELDWKIVLMGYVSGLVIGVVIGNTFISWKHVWFEGNAKRKRRPSQRQPRRDSSKTINSKTTVSS
ncbi:hypothetical protein EUGRSUZ_K00640 [Eucalyptus grandis]|uniref:Uncharacterized protein n=1 Tax=Eucalyptus grandis TaxID=71139 RepID=A0ACC3IQW5_EUCGR|nr:hypothetical protein EUGRSUZ_K00640 [Eucalyptus grandis]